MKDNENIDVIYEMHKNTDFSNAKRVKDIPILKELQEQHGAMLYIQPDLLKKLQDKAVASGRDYQTMANEALEEYLTTH